MFVWSGGAGDRLQVGARAGLAHDAAARVDLDELASLLAVQHALVFLLEPLLADLLARLVVGVAQLASSVSLISPDVADEWRDDVAVGIEAAGRTLDDQPGELRPMLLEHAHHVERRVGDDHRRPARRAPEAPIACSIWLGVMLIVAGEPLQQARSESSFGASTETE